MNPSVFLTLKLLIVMILLVIVWMMAITKIKFKLSTKKINGLRVAGNPMLPDLIGPLKLDKTNYLVVLVLEEEVYTSKELSN